MTFILSFGGQTWQESTDFFELQETIVTISKLRKKRFFIFIIFFDLPTLFRIFGFLSIFCMTANDRGYGHLAVCGLLHCRTTMMLMRAMNFLITRQPANDNRRVLAACRFVVLAVLCFISYRAYFYSYGRCFLFYQAYFLFCGGYFYSYGVYFLSYGGCFHSYGVCFLSYEGYFHSCGVYFLSYGGRFYSYGGYLEFVVVICKTAVSCLTTFFFILMTTIFAEQSKTYSSLFLALSAFFS